MIDRWNNFNLFKNTFWNSVRSIEMNEQLWNCDFRFVNILFVYRLHSMLSKTFSIFVTRTKKKKPQNSTNKLNSFDANSTEIETELKLSWNSARADSITPNEWRDQFRRNLVMLLLSVTNSGFFHYTTKKKLCCFIVVRQNMENRQTKNNCGITVFPMNLTQYDDNNLEFLFLEKNIEIISVFNELF